MINKKINGWIVPPQLPHVTPIWIIGGTVHNSDSHYRQRTNHALFKKLYLVINYLIKDHGQSADMRTHRKNSIQSK